MIRLQDLSVRAGAFSLQGISLEIPSGKCGVLMGKTGCGKTTLLEAICGLKSVESGTIALYGQDITELAPGDRGIGFVPQEGALFSTMTVREHLSFGPSIKGWKKSEINDRVRELSSALGIDYLLDRKPHGLSGGERQRVSLGRALSIRPNVLCLDEPLSALDEDTHGEISCLIKTMIRDEKITALYITHSRREAEDIGDLLIKLESGKVSVVTE